MKQKKLWPKTRGIYLIRNKINLKIYVGQTKDSRGFCRRWYNHRSQLRAQKHDNYHLQNAYNQYGEDSFTFEILEEIEFNHDDNIKDFLNERESFWMIKLESTFPNKGYNTNPLKEYRRPGQNTKRTLPFFQFLAPNGEIVSGQNISGFARDLGLGAWGFRELAAGRKTSHMGYKTTDPELLKEENKFKYCLVDPTGEKHYFNSMGKFAKEKGLSETSLSCIFLEKYGHYMGWRLENPAPRFQKTIDEYFRKIFVKMEDGKIHKFETLSSISRSYNVKMYYLTKFFQNLPVRCEIIKNWSLPTLEEMESLPIVLDGLDPQSFRDRGGVTIWKLKKEMGINLKPVDCFDLDGNFVISYPSMNQAQKTITYQRVRKAVTKPFVLQAGGFYWKLRE